MGVYLEVWNPQGLERVPLGQGNVSVGRASDNQLDLSWDAEVGRLHCALVPYESGWTVRDLGSRNGTFVNGERIVGERALRPGDEVRVGRTRLFFRGADVRPEASPTETADRAPELTPRERDVLRELCRPLVADGVFTAPASIRDMADALVVTESAVKGHLKSLYEKFGPPQDDGRRLRGDKARAWLANEAIHRGALSLAELVEDPARKA